MKSVDKVGKGVTLSSCTALALVFPCPFPGTLHCRTCAEPSEGISSSQLFKVEGSSGYSMLRVPLPLSSSSQAGAVQDSSTGSHEEDLGTGRRSITYCTAAVPFSDLLLRGGLDSVLRLGWFRLLPYSLIATLGFKTVQEEI